MRQVFVWVIVLGCSLACRAETGGSKLKRARETLHHGFADKNPAVRREAALAVGLLGHRENGLSLVAPLLDDSDIAVRIAAIGSLSDLEDKDAIPLLTKALDQPVPEVAFAAAKALWKMKQPAGRQALLSVLEGDKKAESNALRKQFRSVRRSFSTTQGALLFAFKQGVGFVPLPGFGAGVSALESLVSESEFSPRASVAILLAQDRDPDTRQALLDALWDDHWPVRAAAAQAIAMRNDAALRETLVPLFDDSSAKVRYRASAAYLRLSDLPAHHAPGGRRAKSERATEP